ncbi:MAG: SpoIIE family protein phosphatase, partial [Melioribacteraceae bacterium]|nr:SpoIIE family protein phosphatase [Melioribacteraceae bacterium]
MTPIESFDLEYITKSGEIFNSEIVASPILEDDRAIGARGIIRDNSIRVKAEKMLREAKNAAEYRVNELSSINYVAEKVSHSLNLQDILNSACEELTKVFPVRSAGISMLDEEKKNLEIMAFHSINESDKNIKDNILKIDDNEDLSNMLAQKHIVLVDNAQEDPRTKPIHEIAKKNGTKSFIIVPLINRGDLIGIIGMPAIEPNYKFSSNEIELAETIGSQIATAIENARLHTQTEHALKLIKQDLEIGKQIQSGFFPISFPEIEGWEIASYFNPARQVSGDFYDFFQIEESNFYILVTADVCDKGVGAALFMVLLRSLIRSYSEQSNNIIDGSKLVYDIAKKVNHYIVTTHGRSNMFATLLLALLDPISSKLYYINGGHEPPFLVNKKGEISHSLEPTGPAFGFSTEIPFDVGKVNFSDGDILLAYTDGLTEAKDKSGKFYTNERLTKKIEKEWRSA